MEDEIGVDGGFSGDASRIQHTLSAADIEPSFTIPPVSGFWRRFGAFLLDGLLLGIFGQILGWTLSSLWFQVGPYGRIVGQAVALLYFGLLDSRVGNGQTLGKRLLGVAVRNRDGHVIGVGRSMLRTLVWLVPATLNGWALPVMSNPVVGWIASFVIFGVGGAVLVTMVFNRRTRQGLHDMLTQTYVLRLSAQPVESLPAASRLQWVLSGSMLTLALIVGAVLGLVAPRLGVPFQRLTELQRSIQQDERFFSVSVLDQTFYEGGGDTSHALLVQAWYKGVPPKSEQTAILNDIARDAITMDDIDRFDLVRVDVKSAYDLGIATGYRAFGDGQPVSTWRKRTAKVTGAPAP